MPVTIAPISQYSEEWSEVDSLASQANIAADGTGVTLSSSDVWLADADAIAQQIQTGDEVLVSEISSDDLTPRLLDETEVANTNVIAVGSNGFNLNDAPTGSLIGTGSDPAIEQGELSFSLQVDGGTASTTSGSTSVSGGSTSGTTTGLNSSSPLITATSTTSSSSSLTTGTAGGDLPTLEELSSPSAEEIEISSSQSGSPSASLESTPGIVSGGTETSAAVPLELSPNLGLLLLIGIVLGHKIFWSRRSSKSRLLLEI